MPLAAGEDAEVIQGAGLDDEIAAAFARRQALFDIVAGLVHRATGPGDPPQPVIDLGLLGIGAERGDLDHAFFQIALGVRQVALAEMDPAAIAEDAGMFQPGRVGGWGGGDGRCRSGQPGKRLGQVALVLVGAADLALHGGPLHHLGGGFALQQAQQSFVLLPRSPVFAGQRQYIAQVLIEGDKGPAVHGGAGRPAPRHGSQRLFVERAGLAMGITGLGLAGGGQEMGEGLRP